MRPRAWWLARTLLPALVLAFFVSGAFAATSAVPTSRAGVDTDSPTANKLKPLDCAALNLNGILTGSGTFTDGNQPHLVLGSGAVDTIRGGGGDDCILGGAATDSLRGDAGQDVCIGGLGLDTFFASCETQIQ